MAAASPASMNNWGNLFKPDRSPTQLLEALLRGIADYISNAVQPTPIKYLTPAKLASFYRSVGGDYDELFLDTPHASLSFIYQALGCPHSLQPTANDFAPPAIPALTPRGFVRWQIIQLLLGPDEHVPYLQEAVRRFDLINPLSGDGFPKDLPKEAFPDRPDEAMTQWHNAVFEKLRSDALAEEQQQSQKTASGVPDGVVELDSNAAPPKAPSAPPAPVTESSSNSYFPPFETYRSPSGASELVIASGPPRIPYRVGNHQLWRDRHRLRGRDGFHDLSSIAASGGRRRSVPTTTYYATGPDYIDGRPIASYTPPHFDDEQQHGHRGRAAVRRPASLESYTSNDDSEGFSSSSGSEDDDEAPLYSVSASPSPSGSPSTESSLLSTPPRHRHHHHHHRPRRHSFDATPSPGSSPSSHHHHHHRSRDPTSNQLSLSRPPRTNYRGANVRWSNENSVYVFEDGTPATEFSPAPPPYSSSSSARRAHPPTPGPAAARAPPPPPGFARAADARLPRVRSTSPARAPRGSVERSRAKPAGRGAPPRTAAAAPQFRRLVSPMVVGVHGRRYASPGSVAGAAGRR